MSRQFSVDQSEELGKYHYKRKEYQKALDAFTDGLARADRPLLSLMDCRAACFDKLADSHSALREGQKMIRTFKTSAKGYLRTGNLLEKMTKLDTALGIYEHGLKHVSTIDKDRELLRKLRDKLALELAPNKAQDPFVRFPVELVEMILQHLNFHNIVTCLQVSREWRRFFTSQSALWYHLDLSHARKKVKTSFVRECISRSQLKLQKATLHQLYDPGTCLRILANLCKELEVIDILSTSGSIGSSVVETARATISLKVLKIGQFVTISLDAVTQVLRYRPTLEEAEFMSIDARTSRTATWSVPLPNLRKLSLLATNVREARPSLSVLSLPTLFSLTPNLVDLAISHFPKPQGFLWLDLTSLSQLVHLRFNMIFLDTMPLLPPTLETLHFIDASTRPVASHVTASQYIARQTNLPRLRDVAFSGGFLNRAEQIVEIENFLTPGLKDTVAIETSEAALANNPLPTDVNDGVWDTYDNQSQLMRLSLGLSPISDGHSLQAILRNPRLSDLTELSVTGGPLDDIGAAMIAQLFPKIIRLDLSYTRITGVAVRALVDSLRRLRWLKLEFCDGVSPDAIEWAREKGILVTYRMFAGGKGAGGVKRLRLE